MNNICRYRTAPKLVIIFFFLALPIGDLYSQTAKQEIRAIFNELVLAYGSAKSAPSLEVLDAPQKNPAVYYASPTPIIKIDSRLYNITEDLGIDYKDALSIIISHELAHYYNDHTFCTDFAFAVRNESNSLSSRLKAFSKTEKLALETEADHKGLFYAAMAGYKPFHIYPRLLDRIYEEYNLSEQTVGYPSKAERKVINAQAQEKVSTLYELFQKGMAAGTNNDYDLGIESFEELNRFFPSRENYNNLGVFKTLKALKFKPITRAAFYHPERFTYPLVLDIQSRLTQPSPLRSINENQQKEMENLLLSAQKDFEKAISLDRDYAQSYINLACVFDLLGNPEAAIGKIKELKKNHQQKQKAIQILAIAYYNAGWEEKAEEIWENLELRN